MEQVAEHRETLAKPLQRLQMIVAALAMGILSFGVIAFYLVSSGTMQQQMQGPGILTPTSAGVAAFSLVAAAFVPGIIVRTARKQIAAGNFPEPDQMSDGAGADAALVQTGDIGRLTAVFTTALIIRGALLEGAALFCIVAYLLEQQVITMIAAGVLFLLLLAGVPTWSRLQGWLEAQLRHTQNEDMMGGGR